MTALQNESGARESFNTLRREEESEEAERARQFFDQLDPVDPQQERFDASLEDVVRYRPSRGGELDKMRRSIGSSVAEEKRISGLATAARLAGRSLEELWQATAKAVSAPAPEIGTLESIRNEGVRGYHIARQAHHMAIAIASPKTLPDFADDIVATRRSIQSIPTSEALQRFQEQGFLGALKEAAVNPFDVAAPLIAGSLVSFGLTGFPAAVAGGVAGGVAAGAAGGPLAPLTASVGARIGAGVGAGTGSLLIEGSSEFFDFVEQSVIDRGLDPDDPDDWRTVLADPEVISEARKVALQKGIPIALLDALSVGIAGRLTAVAKGPVKKVIAATGEVGIQGVLGGSGEALGQLARYGRIVDQSGVAAEFVAELGPGAVKVAGGVTLERAAKAPESPAEPPVAEAPPEPGLRRPVAPEPAAAPPVAEPEGRAGRTSEITRPKAPPEERAVTGPVTPKTAESQPTRPHEEIVAEPAAPVEKQSPGAEPTEAEAEPVARTPSEEGERVYREVSLAEAELYLPTSNVSPGHTFGPPELFFADTPELAIGQGENKGVLLEFDREGIDLQVSKRKPGLAAIESNELTAKVTEASLSQNLRSVTVKADAKAPKDVRLRAQRFFLRQLETKFGWTKTKNADGSTTYTRPKPPQRRGQFQPEPTETVPGGEAPGASVRRGLINLDPFVKTVEAGLKAGKWTAQQTRAAARWLWGSHGAGVNLGQARRSLVGQFGDGIKRFFGRIWKMFRGGMRGFGDFFAGPGDTSKMAEKPMSSATAKKVVQVARRAKPIRKEFEALKKSERSKRAAVMRSAQQGVGGKEALFISLQAQKGEFERPAKAFEPFADQFTETEEREVYNHIWTHRLGGAPQARMGLANVWRNISEFGYIPTDSEIQRLEAVFGSKLARVLLARRYGLARRVFQVGLDLWNTPKSLKASQDVSAFGRQGLPETLAHPIYATKSGGEMMAAFAQESYAQKVDERLRNHPLYLYAIEDGLFLPSVFGTVDLMAREEMFYGRIIQSTPILRVLVRPSERAFLTYLNLMRMNAYEQGFIRLQQLEVPRRTGKDEKDDYQRLASFVNTSTGRGNIKMGELGPFLNGLLFSPRLTFSHFEYPALAITSVTKRGLSRVVARQLIATTVFMLTIIGLLRLLKELNPDLDVEVEGDMRSSRFGRVVLGENTTIDILGGRARSFSLVAQILSGQRKTKEGKIVKQGPVLSAAWYASGRLAPTPRALLSIRESKRFGGKPVDVFGITADLTVPITVENLKEVMDEHGLNGLWLMGPEILGFGVSVTPKSKASRRSRRPSKR